METLFDGLPDPKPRKTPQTKRCPTCGAKIVRHRHRMTPGLAASLMLLARRAPWKPIAIKELGMNYNQWCNFQKLRYWGVVKHHGTKKSGVWGLTDAGREFLAGVRTLNPVVITFRAEVVGFQGDPVNIAQVMADSPYWDDYETYRDRQC